MCSSPPLKYILSIQCLLTNEALFRQTSVLKCLVTCYYIKFWCSAGFIGYWKPSVCPPFWLHIPSFHPIPYVPTTADILVCYVLISHVLLSTDYGFSSFSNSWPASNYSLPNYNTNVMPGLWPLRQELVNLDTGLVICSALCKILAVPLLLLLYWVVVLFFMNLQLWEVKDCVFFSVIIY